MDDWYVSDSTADLSDDNSILPGFDPFIIQTNDRTGVSDSPVLPFYDNRAINRCIAKCNQNDDDDDDDNDSDATHLSDGASQSNAGDFAVEPEQTYGIIAKKPHFPTQCNSTEGVEDGDNDDSNNSQHSESILGKIKVGLTAVYDKKNPIPSETEDNKNISYTEIEYLSHNSNDNESMLNDVDSFLDKVFAPAESGQTTCIEQKFGQICDEEHQIPKTVQCDYQPGEPATSDDNTKKTFDEEKNDCKLTNECIPETQSQHHSSELLTGTARTSVSPDKDVNILEANKLETIKGCKIADTNVFEGHVEVSRNGFDLNLSDANLESPISIVSRSVKKLPKKISPKKTLQSQKSSRTQLQFESGIVARRSDRKRKLPNVEDINPICQESKSKPSDMITISSDDESQEAEEELTAAKKRHADELSWINKIEKKQMTVIDQIQNSPHFHNLGVIQNDIISIQPLLTRLHETQKREQEILSKAAKKSEINKVLVTEQIKLLANRQKRLNQVVQKQKSVVLLFKTKQANIKNMKVSDKDKIQIPSVSALTKSVAGKVDAYTVPEKFSINSESQLKQDFKHATVSKPSSCCNSSSSAKVQICKNSAVSIRIGTQIPNGNTSTNAFMIPMNFQNQPQINSLNSTVTSAHNLHHYPVPVVTNQVQPRVMEKAWNAPPITVTKTLQSQQKPASDLQLYYLPCFMDKTKNITAGKLLGSGEGIKRSLTAGKTDGKKPLQSQSIISVTSLLANCQIKLIDDLELLPASHLPKNFWSGDFQTVCLPPGLTVDIDLW